MKTHSPSKAVIRFLRNRLPRGLAFNLLLLRNMIQRPWNRRKFSGTAYYCPICDTRISSFLNINGIAICPICRSSERHRVDWLFFKQHTNLFDGRTKRMLHIAPELFFILQFRNLQNLEYVTGDLDDPRAENKIDITNIQYPANYFDVIYCSHVLEHVTHDRQAIMEFNRICKPLSWALLQVPIAADRTFEDPTATEPEDRLRLFGQADHVRICGLDYADRIRDAGFNVNILLANEIMTSDDFQRMGILNRHRYLFYCTKPS